MHHRTSRHGTILRVSSFAVAGSLALLMVTSVLPPLVADQSDRAIIDAPVLLLTAPIEGDVNSLSAELGQYVRNQQPIVQISNAKVDRTTAVQLSERYQSVREKLQSAKRKKSSDREYVKSLDEEIAKQKAHIESALQSEVVELQARLEQSVALSGEKKALVEQQSSMVSRNVLSPELVRRTSLQHSASVHASDAEKAKLTQKQLHLKSLQAGVYVGEALAPLSELVQKRRDIDLDAQRMEIDESEFQAVSDGLEQLIGTETDRLTMLASAEVLAPASGRLLSLGAAAGRHVKAGDTLATLVDCDKRFVVAIFSSRRGQFLNVGNRVKVEGASFNAGIIKAVIPKTSDKTDEQFAVPFPQTERRELYAIITPLETHETTISPDNREAASVEKDGSSSCGVGRWVTVTLESGAVPSMSVTWTKIQRFVSSWGSPRGEAMLNHNREGGATTQIAEALRTGGTSSAVAEHATDWLRGELALASR